jgi:hypothetical protein
MKRLTLAGLAITLGFTVQLQATLIAVNNPSFESPAMGNGGFLFTSDEAYFFSVTQWHRSRDDANRAYFGVYNPVDVNFTGSDTPGGAYPMARRSPTWEAARPIPIGSKSPIRWARWSRTAITA